MIKDNRNTDIKYVDKVNLQYAENNEIIKLISNDTNINSYIKVIAGAYNLNKYEVAIIKYLIVNSDIIINCGELSNKLARAFNKAPITISRAIEDIRKKKLAIININGEIKLSSIIENDINTINKAKFIIIEINNNKLNLIL